ncbi:MAG: hypothetical protein KGI67_05610 [Pseudomonadota bacterium]|nr:hypothetical protein [Pseudomonadota bacterium]
MSTPSRSAARRRPAVLLALGLASAATLALGGCAVVTVADAAVSVAATGVKAGAEVVGTAVDVAASGVRAVAGSGK